VTCKQCGAENPTTSRFCFKCGAELPTLATADVGGTNQGPGSNPGGFSAPPATPGQPTYGGYTPTGMVWRHDQLVGFGTRFVAAVIDGVALAILYGILNAIHLVHHQAAFFVVAGATGTDATAWSKPGALQGATRWGSGGQS